jgi:nucleotide-binding universal stress UspA family protein
MAVPIIECLGHRNGTPLLNYETLGLKDILVPVDGTMASMDALALACVLAKRNKGTVFAVYVIEVSRTMPLDAEMSTEAEHGESVLQTAEDVAAKLDYEVAGELLQARDDAHAIVDEAIERAVGAIILGIPYERPLGEEFKLSDDAQYIIRNAPCQVILCRSSARE